MIELIIIISVIAAIVIFFIWGTKGGEKLQREREEKLSRAEKGTAKILGSSPVGLSGTGHGGHYQAYNFTLEVSSQFIAHYKTSSVWEIYPMGSPKVQQGMEINVKIDADDNTIIYPLAEGVSFSWFGTKMERKK